MVFIFSLLVAVIAFVIWQNAARKVRQNNVSYRSVANLSLPIGIGFSVLTLLQCFTQIPAGHVGVVDFFGIVSDQPLPAGIRLINPLANVVKFSIQTQEHKETMQVLSREGLTIGLEVSALYRLNPDSAARVAAVSRRYLAMEDRELATRCAIVAQTAGWKSGAWPRRRAGGAGVSAIVSPGDGSGPAGAGAGAADARAP